MGVSFYQMLFILIQKDSNENRKEKKRKERNGLVNIIIVMQNRFAHVQKIVKVIQIWIIINIVHKYAMTAKVCKEMVILWYYSCCKRINLNDISIVVYLKQLQLQMITFIFNNIL